MIVTDEDDDTTTTFMTRTAYVRYHDITAWSLREGGREEEEEKGGGGGGGRCQATEAAYRQSSSSSGMFLLPSTHLFTLRLSFFSAPSAPLDFVFSSLFLVFHAPSLFFPSLTPRIPPSSMPRCCTTPWFPLWLFSFTFSFLFSSRLFFFLRTALFLSVLYFSPVAPRFSVKFFSPLRFSSHTVSTIRSKTSSSILRVCSFKENYFSWFSFCFDSFSLVLVLHSRVHFSFSRQFVFPLRPWFFSNVRTRMRGWLVYVHIRFDWKKITNEEQLSRVICTPSIFLLCSIFHLSKLIYMFFCDIPL